MIEIAKKSDAQEIANIIISSIKKCSLDHKNDPKIIEDWLSNKSLENISLWIDNTYSFVYRKNSKLIGFISFSKKGLILLNYTLPENQGEGVGSELLTHVLNIALEINIKKITLESTLTARDFYLHHNFKIIKEIIENNTLIAYLMEKEI